MDDDDVRKRFRSVDDRVDATRTLIDHVQMQLSAQIDKARRDLALLVIRAVLLSTTIVASSCCDETGRLRAPADRGFVKSRGPVTSDGRITGPQDVARIYNPGDPGYADQLANERRRRIVTAAGASGESASASSSAVVCPVVGDVEFTDTFTQSLIDPNDLARPRRSRDSCTWSSRDRVFKVYN